MGRIRLEIVAAASAVAVLVFFLSCERTKSPERERPVSTRADMDAARASSVENEARFSSGVDDVFLGLRNQILELRPETIGLTPSHPGVLAVMMEMRVSGQFVTVVAGADGAASIYLGNGGGILGAGEHAAVRAAGTRWLGVSERVRVHLKPIDQPRLVADEHVQFLVITKDGVLGASAREVELRNGRNELSPLYVAGQDVISAIRVTTSEQPRNSADEGAH